MFICFYEVDWEDLLLCLQGLWVLLICFIFLYQFHALRVRQTLHRTVNNKVPWMMYFFANSVKSYARLVIFFQPKIY